MVHPLPRPSTPRARHAHVAFGLFAATLLTMLVGATGGPARADTAGNPGTTKATTTTQTNVTPNGPLTGLADQSNIHVVVTATAGTNTGFEIRLCRSGVNITGNSLFVPLQGGNCILNPITAGSDAFQTIDADPTLTTATTDFKVGVGTTTWSTPSGSKSVTCDSANPCALWLKESIGAGTFFVHYDLNFGAGGPTVPGKPQTVAAVAGNVSALVSWSPPASDGGAAITGYTVTSTPGSLHCSWTTGTRSCVVPGLASGTPYTFTVKATNSQGAGPASDPSAAVTPTLFLDVPTSSDFFGDIDWMVVHGITKGFLDGGFHPGASVERQAMAAFLYRAKGRPLGDHPTCSTKPFNDVSIDDQFCGEIAWMATQGITNGFPDGGFHPSGHVERQAMAAFLYRFHGSTLGAHPPCSALPFNDVAIDDQFCGEIAWMKANGITKGFPGGTFHPTADVERQAMAAYLHRLSLLP